MIDIWDCRFTLFLLFLPYWCLYELSVNKSFPHQWINIMKSIKFCNVWNVTTVYKRAIPKADFAWLCLPWSLAFCSTCLHVSCSLTLIDNKEKERRRNMISAGNVVFCHTLKNHVEVIGLGCRWSVFNCVFKAEGGRTHKQEQARLSVDN